MHKQIIYLKASTHIYVRIRGKHKQAKKERHCACKKTLRLVVRGGNRTHDLALEDAKSKGLNDLHESVRLDVMDLVDVQKLTYLNASHQIGVGRVMNVVINLVYSIVIQRNIVVIQ